MRLLPYDPLSRSPAALTPPVRPPHTPVAFLPPGRPHARPSTAPGAVAADPGCETGRMPVLDPNPQNGQKKMLIVFGSFLAIFVIIAVIATLASP